MAIDSHRIVFYFIHNVDLVRGTEVDLLSGDSGCTYLLETTDFVSWSDVGGLPWVLRVLALCEPGPEGTISRRSGLDEVVNLAMGKGGVPWLVSNCSSCRENEGGY